MFEQPRGGKLPVLVGALSMALVQREMTQVGVAHRVEALFRLSEGAMLGESIQACASGGCLQFRIDVGHVPAKGTAVKLLA